MRKTLIILLAMALSGCSDPDEARQEKSAAEYHIIDQKSEGQNIFSFVREYRLNVPEVMTSPVTLSPDGLKYLYFHRRDGLWFDSIEADGDPNNLEGRISNGSLGYADIPPFEWSSSSQDIYGVQRKTVIPNGFALEPLSTILISSGGQVRKLPQLEHPAGGLDGILWVGHEGLAIGEFGTKGGYYRPSHEDHNPTIAMVDGRRGHIIQAESIPPLVYEGNIRAKLPSLIGEIDARIDDQGKIHAIFVMEGHRWFEWQQGEKIRPLHSLDIDPSKAPAKWFSATPDFSKVLIVKGLRATGVICEHNPDCPEPTPSTGTIAELRSLDTGDVLWNIEGTAYTFGNPLKPVISLDGQYAIISMPGDKSGRSSLALISMGDGTIIQKIDKPSHGQRGAGFSKDGKQIWVSGLRSVAVYDIGK